GMGKTEAGLLWCGNNKCFFILPLRTAINAMYERFKKNLFTDYKEQVALLHSDIKSYYLQEKHNEYEKNDEQGIDFDYINRSKQLSMPITVCTPDQIFNFVLKYPGYEHKLATMSYSKLIIDEIQMYTPELLAAVMYGIRLIKEMGGKIAVLTATLPPFVRHELQKIYGNDFVEQDFSDYGIVRHNRKTFEKEMTAEDIISEIDKRQDEYSKKILVVCNSIDVADKIYAELKEHYQNEFEVNLFHAHFIRKDRRKKEEAILQASADRTKKEIWVSTSVVEASLDIDFDILFTELSDLFSLFQRMGRVNRKGEKPYDKTNCYVYTELQGNAKRFSFYDKDIYRLSKEAVMNSADGIIDEKQKKYLIDTYLSLENVRKTAYLKTYSTTLTYYSKLDDYVEKDAEKFRRILSYDVIPKEVYQNNEVTIEQAKVVLLSSYRLPDEEKSGLTETEIKRKISQNKLTARNTIESFMVPVSLYRVRNYKDRNLSDEKLGITVIDKCHYDEENGLAFEKLTKRTEDKPDDDSNDNIF
ncbi:MAG: CRISPR-associated helicase Cas3', partial [Clostridia bacterium]|nr:CRISPR-associated helicase Cas3' [Clostridia bacterium]